jgi:hypothetical protein
VIKTLIRKFPSPIEEIPSMVDFHWHWHDSYQKYLSSIPTGALCIMPSWKTMETFDFSEAVPNDFTNPSQYFHQFEIIESNPTMDSIKKFYFFPLDFTQSIEIFESQIKKYRPAGIKLHPLQNFPIEKSSLEPYFSMCARHHLLIYIHTDWVPSAEFGQYRNRMSETFGTIVNWFPDITFIMGHAGNNDSWVNIWKYTKKFPNIVIETSMAPSPGEIEKVIQKCGIERVVFGSNFPFCNPLVEIVKIQALNHVNLEEKQMILSQNALNLLKGLNFHQKIHPEREN